MLNRTSTRTPSYRRHRASGQAVVTIGGKDHYLGKYGTTASRKRYDTLIGEWLSSGRQLPNRAEAGGGPTVAELLVAYLRYAWQYYVDRNGSPSQQVGHIKSFSRILWRLYGKSAVVSFGPRALKAPREAMIETDWSRTYINDQIARGPTLASTALSEAPRINLSRPSIPSLFGQSSTMI